MAPAEAGAEESTGTSEGAAGNYVEEEVGGSEEGASSAGTERPEAVKAASEIEGAPAGTAG